MARVWGTTDADLTEAAAVLRAGGLVAFPTETVYGLGADALSAAAVAGIFAAKGRPATNPVIVHVADAEDAEYVASDWPEVAERLAEAFWPGPLTLVLPRREYVPDIVTAGGTTVGVRCPNHDVARRLIRLAGTPLAAPSANRSTELSPTRAEHVLKSLGDRIAGVIAGGPCVGGIESTVVDVTGDVPRLLRPGLISQPQLEAVVGRILVGADGGVAKSPGQMAKHYSPRAKVRLVDAVTFRPTMMDALLRGLNTASLPLSADPQRAAKDLYADLHRLDQPGTDVIIIRLPPDTPEWAAVRDRLTRAAAG